MFTELLGRLGSALDRAGIPYMVIGGQAVLVHGEPRLTHDIDVTLGARVDQVPTILAFAGTLGLRPLPEDPLTFAKQTMVLPLVDDATAIRVDLIFSWTPFEADAIGRATVVTVDSHAYRVAAAEDLIVLKMLAGRPRDLDDVRGIVIRRHDLDVDLVRRSLVQLRDVADRDVPGEFEAIMGTTRRLPPPADR